jgi:hypothetical protein
MKQRADFVPTLWAEREGIRQVWFAGAHADVGGGYDSHGLADIALEWMVQEVNDLDAGLRLLPGQLLPSRWRPTACRIGTTRPAARSGGRARPGSADSGRRRHPSERAAALQERSDYRPKALEDIPACAPFYRGDEEPAPEEQLQPEREAPAVPQAADRWLDTLPGLCPQMVERFRRRGRRRRALPHRGQRRLAGQGCVGGRRRL